jgi:predicted PurR-regulated permease PerM
MSNEAQRRWAMLILAVLASGAALKVAQPVVAPLALAFVISILLTPMRNLWVRLGASEGIATFFAFLAGAVVLVLAAVLLRPTVQWGISEWPTMKDELTSALRSLRQSFREFYNLQEAITAAIDPGSTGTEAAPSSVSIPTLADAALFAPQFIGQSLILLAGIFFFLLSRADLYRWLTDFLNANTDAKPRWTEEQFVAADRVVNRYFSTVALINIGLGLAVTVGLALIGMSGAAIWGILAALANFIVYLGSAVMMALLLLGGTIAFDGWMAVLPMLIYVVLNFLESQFITPAIVGKRMDVNPLLVFVTLTFAIWLWGATGGIVAIPLLMWVKALGPERGEPAAVVRSEPIQSEA